MEGSIVDKNHMPASQDHGFGRGVGFGPLVGALRSEEALL